VESFATEIITITTNNVTEIQGTSAKSGARIIAISGLTIIGCGVCWDVSPAPTTSNTKLINSGGEETLKVFLIDLHPATNYHIRGYAITNAFVKYNADEKTFTTTR